MVYPVQASDAQKDVYHGSDSISQAAEVSKEEKFVYPWPQRFNCKDVDATFLPPQLRADTCTIIYGLTWDDLILVLYIAIAIWPIVNPACTL